MNKLVALKPRMSEKAYALSQARRTYVFDIPEGVNRQDIARSVAKQYDVNVTAIKLARVRGKNQRTYKSRGQKSFFSKRGNIRKAYVTLKEGDTLPIFTATDEEVKKPEAKEKK